MTGYFRQFLVLKPISEECDFIKSTVKVECDNHVTDITCQILTGCFNLGEYVLILETQDNVSVINANAPKFTYHLNGEGVKNGFSCLLVKNGDFTPLLYGNYNDYQLNVSDLIEKARQNTPEYDDYNIATENYYGDVESEKENVFTPNYGRDYEDEKTKDEKEKPSQTVFYENDYGIPKQNYYQSVKPQLEEILSSHAKDEELKSIIKNGEFVKINYDNERHYTIGKITQNGEVCYLCYAIKNQYGNAPEELSRFCSFMPLSPYSPLGEGYYVMFQRADNGELVTKQ